MTTSANGPTPPSVRRQGWDTVPESDLQRIRAIWREAFPPSERGPHDTVSRRDSTWLWIARAADGTVVGFATALLLTRSATAYLEYLAVAPSTRGGGAGAAVLEAVAADLRAEGAVRGVVLEVEDPARTPDDPLPARRLAFYARWGAHPLGLLRDYSAPDLATPGGRVPMLVLWKGITDRAEPDADGVARLLTDLYRGYYASAAPEGHLDEVLGRISPRSP
ncbi:GNAT family N-acetyltransferase [Umezawaea sp.]|uniref:GNAT family N-acetyltransferase n=1 Tax=Umezawaea sp. TaxID=1955258 RepID=UPI002ED3E3CB